MNSTAQEQLLSNPTRVDPSLLPILRSMLTDSRPAYRDSGQASLEAMAIGILAGIQRTSTRFWIVLHEHRARPLGPGHGAIFQSFERHSPPQSEEDLGGWIVTEDSFRGGALVLVHEMGHFLNRYEVWLRAQQPVPLLAPSLAKGLHEHQLRWTRSTLLNEIAARHLAYLAEEGVDPGRTRLPEPGALFGCAVKIASYPEIYHDAGYMRNVLSSGDRALLRDQVGLWFKGLRGFRFYEPGTHRARIHAQYLEEEIAVSEKGSRAEEVLLEGTL